MVDTFTPSPTTGARATDTQTPVVDVHAAPFNLDADGAAWVSQTLAGMDTKAKVGQLFCLMAMMPDPQILEKDLAICAPGGYMLRPLPAAAVAQLHSFLQSRSEIPMLFAANLEKGADGLAAEGTSFGSELQVSATADPTNAYRMGLAAAREARALGGTWGFSPICDIQVNWRNPITNTRCFGSIPERVRDMTAQFVTGLQEGGLAASAKHFPGDGVDDRDQHLVTSINSLGTEEWDATYGMVYRAAIEAGVKTIMVGHIAQPAYSRELAPGIADEDIKPATLAPELLNGLLREKLGFNGLIITDASPMNGFAIPLPRPQAVPAAIAAGCDMFLFTQDLALDFGYMMAGVEDGTITPERLDEAVTRVLALKASLGLHRCTPAELVPGVEAFEALDRDEHRAWAAEVAGKAITLVKDKEQGLLPLEPGRHRRILLYSVEDQGSAFMSQMMGGAASAPPAQQLADLLAEAGFEPRVFERPGEFGIEVLMTGSDAIGRAELLANYDAVIYVVRLDPASNAPTIRINWSPMTAADSPRYLAEIPTIMVSLGHPFCLQDAPRVKTYINAYAGTDATIAAVADRLLGRAPFTGDSPVDPFCGYWDTRL